MRIITPQLDISKKGKGLLFQKEQVKGTNLKKNNTTHIQQTEHLRLIEYYDDLYLPTTPI